MLDLLIPLYPEIYLAALVIFTLIVGMFSKPENAFKNTFTVAISGLLGVFVLVYVLLGYEQSVLEAFSLVKLTSIESLFVSFDIGMLTKMLVVICGIIILLISKPYLENRQLIKFEYNVLFLASILGAFVALSSTNLLVIYIGLELLSFSTYILVGFNRNSTKALKSANKYFIVGSVSSALMLYGISLLYVTTGSVGYDQLGIIIINIGLENLGFEQIMAMILVTSGLFFKIAIVPLQFYLRDVLFATNRPMLAYISTITKFVGLMLLFQAIAVVMPNPAPQLFYTLMLSFALITIFIGSVTALRENNINRLLAYSSINNAGFMLIAAVLLDFSVTAVYVVNYCLVILAVVSFVVSFKVRGEYIKTLQDLAFVAKKDNKFALLGVFLIFTLAGVPPFMMFYAKLLVIQVLMANGFIVFAVLAVVFSIFAVAYCLRIIKYMYLQKTDEDVSFQIIVPAKILTYILVLLVILFSMFPDILLQIL